MKGFTVSLAFCLLCPAAFLHETTAEFNELAGPVNQLGTRIHKKLSGRSGNIFFSPLSISTALGMLLYGSRGHTVQNMRFVLGFRNQSLTDSEIHSSYQNLMDTLNDATDGDYHLYVANAALIEKSYPVLPSYYSGLQDIYQAAVKEVEPRNKAAITGEINAWVKEKTNNQIKGFLKENQLDSRNPLILLNAVYFKGAWEKEFRSAYESVFFNRGMESKKVDVTFMELLEELPYARIEDDHIQVVEMPYKGEHINMVILFPDAKDGLAELERNLTADTFKEMRQRTTNARVHLSFPKFQLKFKKELKNVLRKLGLEVFDDDADFSGISTEQNLKVSKSSTGPASK